MFLEHRADIIFTSSDRWTSLNGALNNRHIGMIKVLLENGAGAYLINQEYGNMIEAAAHNVDALFVQLLLEVDTDTNLDSDNYGQALQLGYINSNVAVVDALSCAGVDPNRVDGVRHNFSKILLWSGS